MGRYFKSEANMHLHIIFVPLSLNKDLGTELKGTAHIMEIEAFVVVNIFNIKS